MSSVYTAGAIDVHTHLHPPRLFAAIRRWFAEHTDWDLSAHPTEPHAVAAALRAAGVERFVFCSYAHKRGIAAELNGWLVATSRALGGYGVPLATVHLDDHDHLAYLGKALDAGCAGLKVHEDVQRLAVDDVRFDPVYALLAERGCFVLAHVGPIPWTYGAGEGLERVRRALARHPALSFVVAHFGAPDSAGYLELMRVHPNLYLDTTMVFAPDSPMWRPQPVSGAALRANATRILYGTDFPNTMYPYESERRGLHALDLGAAAERAILRDNAFRLLAAAGLARRPGALRSEDRSMNDKDVHDHIEELVAEEHRLLDHANEKPLDSQERRRLDDVQVQLDRYYDLLRQRRAREEFAQDPDSAALRSADTVERYLQ